MPPDVGCLVFEQYIYFFAKLTCRKTTILIPERHCATLSHWQSKFLDI